MIKIDTAELSRIAGSPGMRIIDTRPIAAFNGWPLRGEATGGHIPGAVSFPLAWATNGYRADLSQRLRAKGVDGERLIVYGYDATDAGAMAAQLESAGFEDVSVYDGYLDWADRGLPLARLANHEKLVSPEWLYRHKDGDSLRIFHVNFGVPEEYEAGHIPSAVYLDTNQLESSADWNRRSPGEIEAALVSLGIDRDTSVVVYGRDSAPGVNESQPGRMAGQIAAARAAAIMMYAGVNDVRLLDGGYNGWAAAGYEIETKIRSPQAVGSFGADIPGNPEYFIDFEEAKALTRDPGGVLVSIRTRDEFEGKTSGYNYIASRGDIPGAVWGNCGSDAYHMQHYRNIDNTMRDFNEIARNWRGAGITPDKQVAFYCGTGWRASETFFYAFLMGWPRVAVYDGGWFEWIRRNGA